MYVEAYVEYRRTRVRLPPPPPFEKRQPVSPGSFSGTTCLPTGRRVFYFPLFSKGLRPFHIFPDPFSTRLILPLFPPFILCLPPDSLFSAAWPGKSSRYFQIACSLITVLCIRDDEPSPGHPVLKDVSIVITLEPGPVAGAYGDRSSGLGVGEFDQEAGLDNRTAVGE